MAVFKFKLLNVTKKTTNYFMKYQASCKVRLNIEMYPILEVQSANHKRSLLIFLIMFVL